jgi:hypothetical protein
MLFARSLCLTVLPLALAFTPLAAHADTFDWSLSSPAASLGGFPETGSGTLTATDSGGQWTINSITGTLGGSTITGLASFFGSDNLLFPNSTFLDTDGLAFKTANGTEADIWSAYAPGSTDITPGNNYDEILGGTASADRRSSHPGAIRPDPLRHRPPGRCRSSAPQVPALLVLEPTTNNLWSRPSGRLLQFR